MAKLFSPREYQEKIIGWQLDQRRNGVWCFMGGGKTVATLTTIDTLFKERKIKRPALIIAPLRVAQSTWPDEVTKWDHLSDLEVQPITGSVLSRTNALKNKNANIFTINYENIPWLVEQGDWNYQLIASDESTKLKSFRLRQGGSRAQALAKVAHRHCTNFFELTGTPAPNGLIDLWGQAWFLDGGLRLGKTFTAFLHRWFTPHWSGFGWMPRQNADKEIKELLADLYLSVKAEDYFPITQPIYNQLRVELPAKVRSIYRDMEREMLMNINDRDVSAVSAADRSLKCLQICNGAIYNEGNTSFTELHDAKLEALERLVADWQGEPVLVAYHFKHDLQRLQQAFKKGRVLDKDPKTIRDWNAGKIPLLFAHPQSAGHGLNLQDGGRIIVFFGHWWNNEEREQIIERLGPVRQEQAGHPRSVFLYDIIATDTVDELVSERHKSKREVNELLLDMKKRRGL